VESCTSTFDAAPTERASARCFYDIVYGGHPEFRPAAVAEAERLLRRNPERPWLTFYLAALYWTQPNKAIPLYESALAQFTAQHDLSGEFTSRFNLFQLFSNVDNLTEARRVAEPAIRLATGANDPLIVSRGRILEARLLEASGTDLERAWRVLLEVESIVSSLGNYTLERDWLHLSGLVADDLGRFAQEAEFERRLVALTHDHGDRFAESAALYGLMIAHSALLNDVPTADGHDEIQHLAEQTCEVAAKAGSAAVEAKARWFLARLLPHDEALHQVERCLEVAPSPLERSLCLTQKALLLAPDHPDEARKLADEAIAAAREGDDPYARVFAWRERMLVSWKAGPRARAVADSRSALDAIEALRDLQGSNTGRAEFFSTWAEDYHWLAGRLLREYTATGDEADLTDAFDVLERMRARALVDALEAARATPRAAEPAAKLQEERAAALEEIASLRRRMQEPALSAGERARLAGELSALEERQGALRRQVESSAPGFAALRLPALAGLSEVRGALAPDEALIAFQEAPETDYAGEFAGGSWLLAVTREAVRVYPSLDRVRLRPAERLFAGLFASRDGAEAAPAEHLGQEIFGAALAGLPPAIDHLIVVPDDALFLAPFGDLRPGPGAAPLVGRFAISEVPSATLWLRWRRSPPAPAAVPDLGFADPRPLPLPAAGETPAERSADAPARPALPALPSLPQARREVREMNRRLGGGGVLRVGDEATEAYVKAADLSRFGILHFATHAISDDDDPAASAVMLAPGSPAEDGRLTMREIVDLHLDGQVVVLAACRSASGELLRGEGVMGLARAFFQAGAHAVVASLWPLGDDDAAALFGRFYAHLGDGESVVAALTAAQRDRLAAGAPAAAWAGLVVLGDGDLVPVPGGVPHRLVGSGTAAAAAGLLIAGLVGAGLLRRRRAR
jgi:tetratricopeptide (TPR) repeat protein